MKPTAKFKIACIENDTVHLVDIGGPTDRSVTNDAEAVVEYVNMMHPGLRIVYLDSAGSIDELVHNDGFFIGYKHLPDVNGSLGKFFK